MNIIKVHNNWNSDTLGLDIGIGNACNYKCSYCWPGANDGSFKFPNVDLLKKNLTHLINYYKENTNKNVFDIHFVGGEPTHWPKLFEFIKYLKENFNCLISMTSNGSKKISWWKEAAPYFDRVSLSCHHEYVDIEHFREVSDLLYEAGVVSSVSVMMDPRAWTKCMTLVDELKKSRKSWTIRYVELIADDISYTPEQTAVIKQHRARKVNLLWFLWHNKYYRSKVSVVDAAGKTHSLQENEILLKRLNNFYGWECSLGVDRIHVSFSGELSGTCGQLLYGESTNYNLYDSEFPSKFNPNIIPAVCTQIECTCNIETIMPKQLINNRRVIPIHAN